MGVNARELVAERGFTLIELMMVIVIVAVLATIALPAYQGFVVKANRGEAQAYLLKAAQRQQLFFNDTRTYASDPNDLNIAIADRVSSNYDVSIAVDPNAPPTYTITAAPKSGTAQVDDGTLTIDNTGQKQRAGGAW